MAHQARFWRNVVMIGVAHVVAFVALIWWSRELSAKRPNEIVWLSGSDAPSVEGPAETPLSTPEPIDAPPEDEPATVTPKSEITLATPTPAATPKPKPKITPTPAPRKKSERPKASPTPAVKKKAATPAKTLVRKSDSVAATGKVFGAGRGAGSANASQRASEFASYNNMLHDRFYSAWVQPTSVVATDVKLSATVKIRIERDGRVSQFEIVSSSGNVVLDESVQAVAGHVTRVDPLPAGLGGDYYEVTISFVKS